MLQITFIISLLIGSQLTLAAPKSLSASGGQVEFAAIGKPSFIHINGKGQAATGEVQIEGKSVKGSFEFPLATLDTGMNLRNEYMRDNYLKVKDHPTAKLEIKDLTLNKDFDTANPQIDESDFTGDLTLHGVSQPVKGKFSVKKAGEINAAFNIKLSDFKIDIPKYMGITVADQVDVKVTIAELKAR